ncbi:MAG: hypothetical protein WB715_03420 [Roseiarcus sp.]|uniref:hypothetical protein n=1 Tax=Roseiarcus sp. TaxID=1969460 RepID=UPI003C4927D8
MAASLGGAVARRAPARRRRPRPGLERADEREYCKAHQNEKIIYAIGVVFKDMRAEGMMMEK